jgi:hypothetical protein
LSDFTRAKGSLCSAIPASFRWATSPDRGQDAFGSS